MKHSYQQLCLATLNEGNLKIIVGYNLGQNKKEQLTPFPPKAMMKAREDQIPPF